ncbi:MAG: NlpC/P60 family protein [Acetivibrio ethanolgignens]
MNRNRKWMAALGIAGVTVIAAAAMPSSASVLLSGTEVAGITLNLSNYAQETVSEDTTEVENPQVKIIAENDTAEEKIEEKEEEFKLNLVYDRLGVAKVDNWLNIRKGPGEDKTIIGKLPKNAGCHIYKINKDGWAKIVSGKVTGWVKAEYLVTDEEAEEYAKEVATRLATVNTTTLKLRTLPTTDSRVYDLVGIEEEMDVKKEKLTESYVQKFVDKLKEEDKEALDGIDIDAMMADLGNWVCVTLDSEKVFVSKEFVDISYKLERAVAVGEVKADEANGISSTRADMVEFAKKYLGGKYVYGGTSLTNGTDCSGFTMRIYEHFGYSIPRTSSAQASYFTGIKSSEAKPGDLFFYGSNGRVSHVAMYIGDGQVIHASNARTGIKISNAFYRTPIKVGRIIK